MGIATKDRLCTIKDSVILPPSTNDMVILPPVSRAALTYLKAIPDKWTSFAELKKAGYVNFHWFDELRIRGLCESRMAPHKIAYGRRWGSRYWFRAKKGACAVPKHTPETIRAAEFLTGDSYDNPSGRRFPTQHGLETVRGIADIIARNEAIMSKYTLKEV